MSHPHQAPADDGLSQVDYVRSRPDLYFRGPVDRAWLVGLVLTGALTHGATDVQAEEQDGWWVITSSHDWLGAEAMDAFFTLKPDPRSGPNTHRMEILLPAFTQDVWTATPSDPVAISRVGPVPPPVQSWIDTHSEGRVIAFRFSDDATLPAGRHLALVPFEDALREFPDKLDSYP